mmetsp:Transcript_26876/g.37875  ORF Transcript_26876/g.37875 Transcript_26876/m.37875 type:complete len:494 (-) Transcript_26876:45-1526(-)
MVSKGGGNDTIVMEEELSLRATIEKKPANAKAMACLSCLLMDRAKRSPPSQIMAKQTQNSCREEALSWARKAIESKPKLHFGYAALSEAAPTHTERMKALQRAVELTSLSLNSESCEKKDKSNRTIASYAGNLVRLLIESRDDDKEENTTCSKKNSKKKSALRKDLDSNETALYQKAKNALTDAWNATSSESPSVIDYLAKVEYRLGLFFRKMKPHNVHRPRARQHLTKCCDKLDPNNPLYKKARFWLATFSQDANDTSSSIDEYYVSVDRCPEDYVIGLYSSFAEKFDELLVTKLKYETPTKLRQLLDSAVGSNKKWAKTSADLGCGTGLSGIAFQDCTLHITGVDLSPAMIEKAKERKCYDKLVVGDVTCILEPTDSSDRPVFDLIFACDVFVYIGDLKGVFESAKQALSQDTGLFAFSTEHLEEHVANGHPYILQQCARFAHKQSYIERLAQKFGFDIVKLVHSPIRKNEGKDVGGMLVILRSSKETSRV